jgi:5-methylcytosine-specific restriction endonuclease McrA
MKIKARPCVDCGAEVRSFGSIAVCVECRPERRRETRRTKERRRRAALYAAKSEPYTLNEIAERDGYRCQLCGQAVAMGEPVPHPHAPTIDHIVPLAGGGDDTRANIWLAHFLCNVRKGTRPLDEALARL